MSHNQRVIIYESFSMSHNLWIKLIESRSWQQFKQHLKPKLAFFRNPRNFKKFSRDQNYHKWIRNKILNHMICITCMVNHFWIDLSNSRIFDDVIPGRLWRHRTKSLCVNEDFGLNFHIFQSVLNFRQPVFLWTLWKEAYFSIFKIEKIDQKWLKFNIWRWFLDKSTTLNPMSLPVFLHEKVGRLSILIM